MFFMPTSFGFGFQVATRTCIAFNRGGLAKLIGQTVQFDFRNNDPATLDNNMDGGEDSGFANLNAQLTTPSGTTERFVYGVITGQAETSASASSALGASVPDDAPCEVTLQGVCTAAVFEATAVTIDKGHDLFVRGGASPGHSGCLVGQAALAAGFEYPIVGKSLAAVVGATGANGTFSRVLFWGGLPYGVKSS